MPSLPSILPLLTPATPGSGLGAAFFAATLFAGSTTASIISCVGCGKSAKDLPPFKYRLPRTASRRVSSAFQSPMSPSHSKHSAFCPGIFLVSDGVCIFPHCGHFAPFRCQRIKQELQYKFATWSVPSFPLAVYCQFCDEFVPQPSHLECTAGFRPYPLLFCVSLFLATFRRGINEAGSVGREGQ